MKAQHSPGPWLAASKGAYRYLGGKSRVIFADDYGRRVTIVPADDSEDEANARLIAAAPELLEALEIAVADMLTLANPAQKAAIRIGQAALDKARGAL